MTTPRETPAAMELARNTTPLEVLRFLIERRHLQGSVSVSSTAAVPTTQAKFQRVDRVVRQTPEEGKLATTNFIASLTDSQSSFVCWIRSDGRGVEQYFGLVEDVAVSDPKEGNRVVRALQASLPGTKTTPLGVTASTAELKKLQGECVVAIEGIPSLRMSEPALLDRTLEGVLSVPFDLLVISDAVPTSQLDAVEELLAEIYGQLHALSRQQVTDSAAESFSKSFTDQVSRSDTTGSNWSVTDGHSHSTSTTEQHDSDANRLGTAFGGLLGAALGLVIDSQTGGTGIGASLGGSLGTQLGRALSGGGSESVSTSESRQRSATYGESSSVSHGESHSRGEVWGLNRGRQWSLELVNRQAIAMLDVLDSHFERIRRARAVGFWNARVFLVARDRSDARTVANAISASIRGDHTHLEPIRTVFLENPADALQQLCRGRAPVLSVRPHPLLPAGEQFGTLLTSDELALWVSPPTEDLPGIPARPSIRFGSNVPKMRGAQSIDLGHLELWNQTIKSIPVSLAGEDLCSHGLVVGTTGSGKTTTVKSLLAGLQSLREPVPFMVVEPAKSEYEDLFDKLEQKGQRPLRVGIRDGDGCALRFNPFAPPRGLPLSWYVDSLKLLLRSCFSMQESLPQLLERLILDAYIDMGWTDFTELVEEQHPFPTFQLLLHRRVVRPAFPTVANGFRRERWQSVDGIKTAVHSLGYDPRAQATLSAALRVRIESFSQGLKGRVFSGEALPLDDWLSRPVFLSLSDIKDSDVRRFIIGALFLQIYGYREVEGRRNPASKHGGLRHLLVLEEAHHFVENTAGLGPGAELVRESNRVVANSLAELRAYGQGILIVDQSPTALDPSVLQNTNTKLVHRLLFDADCQAAGSSIGLDDQRIGMLRSLSPGEAVLFAPSFVEPVAVRIHNR